MTLIISVNGNIACGKSTLLRALEKRGYAVVMEGLDRDEWGNVLSMYYKNPKRYGYLFQTLVAAEMKETYAALRAGKYEKFTEKKDPKVIFTERSHVDCLAFAKLVWRQSNMSNVEYQTFKRIYNIMLEQPDVIISLELAPEICFERCKARARKCENELQLSYLQEVDKTVTEVMSDNQSVENAPKQIKINVLGKTTRSIVEEVEKSIDHVRGIVYRKRTTCPTFRKGRRVTKAIRRPISEIDKFSSSDDDDDDESQTTI